MSEPKSQKKRAIKKLHIVRKELDNSHYYWVDGEYFPGVTSILDEAAPVAYGLKQFFLRNTPESAEDIRRTTADFGTMIHAAIERLLKGEEIDLEKEFPTIKAKKHLLSFAGWFQWFKPDVNKLQVEHMVASKKYKYAGTLDLACIKDGELWIIDWKTSAGIYFNHELQITAYGKAYDEMYERKVDHTAILRTGSRHMVGYEFKEVKRPFQHFLNTYKTYKNLHGGKIPDPPEIDIYPATLRIIK